MDKESEHIKTLSAARERLIAERRALAGQLAKPYERVKPQSAERNSSPSKRRLKRLTSHWQMKSKSQTPAGRRWAEKWLPVPVRVIFIIGASAPHSTSLAGDTRCRKRNGGAHWRRGRNHVAPHRKWPSLDRPRYAQTNRRSQGAMSEMGYKSPTKIHLCPLLSKSGQTRMRSDCPLSANSGHSRVDSARKKKDRLAA